MTEQEEKEKKEKEEKEKKEKEEKEKKAKEGGVVETKKYHTRYFVNAVGITAIALAGMVIGYAWASETGVSATKPPKSSTNLQTSYEHMLYVMRVTVFMAFALTIWLMSRSNPEWSHLVYYGLTRGGIVVMGVAPLIMDPLVNKRILDKKIKAVDYDMLVKSSFGLSMAYGGISILYPLFVSLVKKPNKSIMPEKEEK